jgi:hypothetical protein
MKGWVQRRHDWQELLAHRDGALAVGCALSERGCFVSRMHASLRVSFCKAVHCVIGAAQACQGVVAIALFEGVAIALVEEVCLLWMDKACQACHGPGNLPPGDIVWPWLDGAVDVCACGRALPRSRALHRVFLAV